MSTCLLNANIFWSSTPNNIGSSHLHWTIILPKIWQLKTSKQPSLITFGTVLPFTHPSFSLGKQNTPKKRPAAKTFPEGSDFNLEELQGPGRWGKGKLFPSNFTLTKIWCFKFEGRKIRPGCESERFFSLTLFFLLVGVRVFFSLNAIFCFLHCWLMCSICGHL